MSRLLDPKSKAIMDQNVADAEARGDFKLANELREVQAELVHKLDQAEERMREEGSLDRVVQLLSALDQAEGW